MKRYLNAQEVADMLGIHITSVYAYVSRGLIRSEATGDGKRSRRYYAEDVELLRRRQEQRQHPEKFAEFSLNFGAPLLESALTLIADGRVYYRGHDVMTIAQTRSIEAVAGLLWAGDLDEPISSLRQTDAVPVSARIQQAFNALADASPFERFQAILPLAALDDVAAYDLRVERVIQTGGRILRLLTHITAGQPADSDGIAGTLQRAWRPDSPDVAYLINMALVLCADHELNVSSFTARCVASAGSTPYAAVIAGLAALQGIKHGGSTERVAAMLHEIGGPDDAARALANRIRRGDDLPGFGHRLYPDGDPRGRLLLDAVAAVYPDSAVVRLADAVMQQVLRLTGQHPNIDLGLVIMALALNLPPGTPLTLFALGRTVGWIGHALEEYATDRLIRPRARYTGVLPTA